MTTALEQSKYSAEQTDDIINRITALRVRWLLHVKTQLASQQSRPMLNGYELSSELGE